MLFLNNIGSCCEKILVSISIDFVPSGANGVATAIQFYKYLVMTTRVHQERSFGS